MHSGPFLVGGAWKNKKGSKTDPSNYKPISFLFVLPKAFERVVLDQTKEFVSRNKILYDYRSGFRINHSTCTSLCEKCPYSELFWSTFSRIRLNMERYSVSLRSVFSPYVGKFRPE